MKKNNEPRERAVLESYRLLSTVYRLLLFSRNASNPVNESFHLLE
jgi:hypothetical protein